MIKEEIISDCEVVLNKVKELLLASKVKIRAIELLANRFLKSDDIKSSYFREVHKKLKIIDEKIYPDYCAALSLLPNHVWAQYKMMGFEGLREQVILNNVLRECRKMWLEIPKFTKAEYGKKITKKVQKI